MGVGGHKTVLMRDDNVRVLGRETQAMGREPGEGHNP